MSICSINRPSAQAGSVQTLRIIRCRSSHRSRMFTTMSSLASAPDAHGPHPPSVQCAISAHPPSSHVQRQPQTDLNVRNVMRAVHDHMLLLLPRPRADVTLRPMHHALTVGRSSLLCRSSSRQLNAGAIRRVSRLQCHSKAFRPKVARPHISTMLHRYYVALARDAPSPRAVADTMLLLTPIQTSPPLDTQRQGYAPTGDSTAAQLPTHVRLLTVHIAPACYQPSQPTSSVLRCIYAFSAQLKPSRPAPTSARFVWTSTGHSPISGAPRETMQQTNKASRMYSLENGCHGHNVYLTRPGRRTTSLSAQPRRRVRRVWDSSNRRIRMFADATSSRWAPSSTKLTSICRLDPRDICADRQGPLFKREVDFERSAMGGAPVVITHLQCLRWAEQHCRAQGTAVICALRNNGPACSKSRREILAAARSSRMNEPPRMWSRTAAQLSVCSTQSHHIRVRRRHEYCLTLRVVSIQSDSCPSAARQTPGVDDCVGGRWEDGGSLAEDVKVF
ncbi:hypothetical protein C8Q80DRAFT_856131 [Daedaleopsis nitida]|nr:hypothetical protein C8Q80DRAFT_856131 [Daedaleopsis nitida]